MAEKVETIRDLTVDETVAAQAACELLHRPELAFRASRSERHLSWGGSQIQVGTCPPA
ncbi:MULTISPECIES: DUF6192 family protein [Streptomyces]|uniref:DUF6192 family protein n=1 Tax=Streptomyces TaxID=1883 RepID=UPI003404690A